MRELEVLPSTRVSSMELCSRDDGNLKLKNKERLEWPAGGMLENLFYKLYDEAGRGVPITAEIASKIKVCVEYISQCLTVVFTVSYPVIFMWKDFCVLGMWC